MYRLHLPVLFYVFLSMQILCFAGENGAENNPTIYFMPIVSYKMISFENITFHNPTGGIAITRLNPTSTNLFSVAAMYAAAITEGVQNNYPNMYHNVVLSFNGKIGRHSLLGTFGANTDKPFYGGLNTVNAFGGYTYDLINGPHFSMNLGGYLMFRDIGINLPDGTPWLFWPLPFLALKWDYEWIDVSFLPGITITIADGKPFSFTISKKSDDFDTAFWHHYFRNNNPAAEIFGIGIGLKNTTSKVTTAEGNIYGINYYALYGGIRIFRLIEINGGWAFNGKEKYDRIKWDDIVETYGASDELDYNTGIGNGFFFSISARFII
jgi:hypothetical protein